MKLPVSISTLVICVAISAAVCGCLSYYLPGGDHEWDFASGEYAIEYHGMAIPGVTLEMCQTVIGKVMKHEAITGRQVVILSNYDTSTVEKLCGIPSAKRPSQRKGYDTEWEYGWWVVYFRGDLVADVQFNETVDEPAPIYRWSGKYYHK